MNAPRKARVSAPYHADPASVLVMICCDGRYIDAVAEFLRGSGIDRHDLIALPGGPALLCHEAASFLEFQAARDALDLMLPLHRTRLVVLIAHHDCAWYRTRLGRSDPEVQRQHLRVAAAHLHERHPGVQLALHYARPRKKGSAIAIEKVDPA